MQPSLQFESKLIPSESNATAVSYIPLLSSTPRPEQPHLLPTLRHLPVLDMSHEQHHVLCDLVCLASSLKHDFSRFTPAVACVSTLPLHCYVIFHFTYTPHFLFPGSADADVSFLPVAATDNAAVSTHAGFPSLLGNN